MYVNVCIESQFLLDGGMGGWLETSVCTFIVTLPQVSGAFSVPSDLSAWVIGAAPWERIASNSASHSMKSLQPDMLPNSITFITYAPEPG